MLLKIDDEVVFSFITLLYTLFVHAAFIDNATDEAILAAICHHLQIGTCANLFDPYYQHLLAHIQQVMYCTADGSSSLFFLPSSSSSLEA